MRLKVKETARSLRGGTLKKILLITFITLPFDMSVYANTLTEDKPSIHPVIEKHEIYLRNHRIYPKKIYVISGHRQLRLQFFNEDHTVKKFKSSDLAKAYIPGGGYICRESASITRKKVIKGDLVETQIPKGDDGGFVRAEIDLNLNLLKPGQYYYFIEDYNSKIAKGSIVVT